MISMRRLLAGEATRKGSPPLAVRSSISRVGVLIARAYTVPPVALPGSVQSGSGRGLRSPVRLLDSRITSTYTSRGVEGLALRNPGNHRQVTGGKVPIPGDVWPGFALFATRDKAKVYSEGAQMAVSHLQCKECK